MWANTPINKQLSQWSSHNVCTFARTHEAFLGWCSVLSLAFLSLFYSLCHYFSRLSWQLFWDLPIPFQKTLYVVILLSAYRFSSTDPQTSFISRNFFFFLLIWYFINSNKETWTWQKLFFLWNHHDQNSPQFGSWFDVCLSLAVKDVITTTAGSKQKSKCGCGNAYSVCCSQLSCSNWRCFFGHRSGRCAGICKVCVWFILN